MNVIILISEELEGLQDIPKKIQKEQYEREFMKSLMVCSVWWLLFAPISCF